MAIVADDDPILNPPKEWPAWVIWWIDFLSWAFPAVAALLSILAGVAALNGADAYAASLGIVAGVLSASGVGFTNGASRIRDTRLKVTHALAQAGFNTANETASRD